MHRSAGHEYQRTRGDLHLTISEEERRLPLTEEESLVRVRVQVTRGPGLSGRKDPGENNVSSLRLVRRRSR